MSPDEWMSKTEWEGGVFEGLEYGLTEENVSHNWPLFRELVLEARIAYENLQAKIDLLYAYDGEEE